MGWESKKKNKTQETEEKVFMPYIKNPQAIKYTILKPETYFLISRYILLAKKEKSYCTMTYLISQCLNKLLTSWKISQDHATKCPGREDLNVEVFEDKLKKEMLPLKVVLE